MATEDVQRPDPDSPEVRLTQFLFVGKEYPDYQPGDWFVHKYYLAANVPSVEELAKNPDKQLLPIELIKKAYESHLVPNPETLVFVLAVCAKQRVNEQLRKAAYKAVQDICASPKDFLLFVKFCHQLSILKQLNLTGTPSHGWGNGMRKAMNNWYLSKDPMELAKFVTRYKSRYGWKHKDVLKLSHLQPSSQENEVVFKYIMNGFREAQKMYPDNPKVQDIIQYIQQVEDFKHCEDEVQSAGLLEQYNLALEHVPGHMLKSREVWTSLIPTMDTITLLNNLQRIHNLDILKPNSLAVEKILDQLHDQSKVSQDKPHPALVLITIKNYENSGKPLSYEKRKVKEQAKKVLPPPPKPNSKIIDALYKTLNYSFDHLKPTGLRYMVTINMNKIMLETRAWHCGNLSGAEVGCIIALSLLRCEKNVIIATFKNVGIHSINLDKKSSFGQTMRRLQQMPVGIVNLGKPMAWASYQNNKVDVFINITDQISEKLDTSYEDLEAYRTKMKLPQTKLINCAVCSSSVFRKKDQDKNVLTIAGFDASVPTVIEAFAKSLF